MELPIKMKGIHFPALLKEKIFLEEEFLVSNQGELFTIIYWTKDTLRINATPILVLQIFTDVEGSFPQFIIIKSAFHPANTSLCSPTDPSLLSSVLANGEDTDGHQDTWCTDAVDRGIHLSGDAECLRSHRRAHTCVVRSPGMLQVVSRAHRSGDLERAQQVHSSVTTNSPCPPHVEDRLEPWGTPDLPSQAPDWHLPGNSALLSRWKPCDNRRLVGSTPQCVLFVLRAGSFSDIGQVISEGPGDWSALLRSFFREGILEMKLIKSDLTTVVTSKLALNYKSCLITNNLLFIGHLN